MLAAQTRVGTGYYLPTVYTSVFAFTFFSGIHYIFFVSRLLNEDAASAVDLRHRVDNNTLRYYSKPAINQLGTRLERK